MPKTRKNWRVVDAGGVVSAQSEKMTLTAARKQIAADARADRARCKQHHGRCTIVGTAKSGVMEVRIGGKQGHHMWSRYALRDSGPFGGTRKRRRR